MVSPAICPERLLVCPWIPVDIGGSRFLCKSWFGQKQYQVLLMDSRCLWEEHMEADAIQTRAQELNRRLRAPIEAFFSHLVAVVTPCLTESGRSQGEEAQVTLQQQWDGHMTLRLKSELAGLPFYWEFHCSPAPVTTACDQLVHPLLAMSSALQRQVEHLGKLLQKKDAEIQDYRENGAMLSRERLQTEPFEEETFRDSFMAKTLPLLLNQHQNSLNFDSALQRLYSDVVSEQSALKRKRQPSEEEHSREDGQEPSLALGDGSTSGKPGQKETEQSENTKTQTLEAKKTRLPTMQQSVPSSSLGAAERPAAKPKKKKVGLFR